MVDHLKLPGSFETDWICYSEKQRHRWLGQRVICHPCKCRFNISLMWLSFFSSEKIEVYSCPCPSGEQEVVCTSPQSSVLQAFPGLFHSEAVVWVVSCRAGCLHCLCWMPHSVGSHPVRALAVVPSLVKVQSFFLFWFWAGMKEVCYFFPLLTSETRININLNAVNHCFLCWWPFTGRSRCADSFNPSGNHSSSKFW